MLEFIWPWFLLLIPLPFIARLLEKKGATQDNTHESPLWWPDVALFIQPKAKGKIKNKNRAKRLIQLFTWLAWGLLVIAIARPVWLGDVTSITPSGRDMLIALDLSGSMQITDMKVRQQTADRLQAAKHVLDDFITQREGDRIGIIVFGSKAYLQAPLSFDLDTIAQLVAETQIGFAGENTAIGDAIGLGIKRLMDKDSEQRVMILMTDGANTAGRVKPDQAAQFAAQQKVKVHTIGIGAEEMIAQGFFGPKVVNPSADLDEELLTLIASTTGGEYFRAKSTEDLQRIYDILDQLEPTPGDELWQRPKTSLFNAFSLAALLCLFIALLIRWNAIRTGGLS